MVVAQLVERSLMAPEIRSSNPVIVNFINFLSTGLYLIYIKKTKIRREKEAGNSKRFQFVETGGSPCLVVKGEESCPRCG